MPTDVALCAAAFPWMEDGPSALASWRHLLRPGTGRLALHGFGRRSFVTGVALGEACRAIFGPDSGPARATAFNDATGDAAACRALMSAAGFDRVTVLARGAPEVRT